MRNYEIENEMYKRAVELIETRYPALALFTLPREIITQASPLRRQTPLPWCASSWEQCLKLTNTMKR